MSTKRVSPPSAPPGAKPRRESRKTRRGFLKALAVLPVAAGAAGLGRAVAGARETNSEFPGDPAAWRQRLLAEARAPDRLGVAEADVAVRERARGAVPADAPPRAPVAAATAPLKSDVLRMQEDLQRAMQ